MRHVTISILMLLLATAAMAKQVSVVTYSANIHSSPILYDYNIIKQAPRYYPLSVLEEKGEFYRIVDYKGEMGWVHKSVVSQTPTVVIRAANINVRKGPGTNHPVVFRAKQGVAFKVLKKGPEWLQVEHESGSKGWVFKALVWGSK